MDRRESSADEERMDEGNTPPEEVLNPPDDGGDANEDLIYAQGNFPTIYEYEEAGSSAATSAGGGHSATSAVAALCQFGLIPNIYATEMNDPSSGSDDDDPAIIFRDDEYHQEVPSGATYSSERERKLPHTSSMVLDISKRALPKSEGRMAAYVKKLRRERDRILSSINEQTAMLHSLYEMLDNPPEPSNTTWFDNFRTYNVDQSLGVNNKMRYFSLMSGNSIYFVQGACDRISYASGYTFDGTSLSRNPDVPPVNDNPRRRINFSEGGFTVGRSASVDSLPALVEPDRCPIGEINSESGQRTEGTFGIISPIEDDSSSHDSLPALVEPDRGPLGEINSESGQRTEGTFGIISPIKDDSSSHDSLPALIEPDRCSIGEVNSERSQRTEGAFGITSPIEEDSSSRMIPCDTDQLETGSGSNEDSSHNNQLESETGNPSNFDSTANERLVRSTSNQASSESGSNQDSSNSNQLQSSTTNQDSSASTHNYAIPGPSSSNVYFAGADNPSSEEHSFASNFESNVNTVYSSNPAPSGNNQNRDQEVSNSFSNTGNVGTDRIAVSQYGEAALVPSPQVPIAMHSNQSFYNPAAGNFNAVTSPGQNMVSSYSATNYSDSRISSAVVNTATGGYVPVPNAIYASGETAAFNANVPGQSFTHPGYHNPGGNYGTIYGYSNGHGSRNTPINMHPPVAVSSIVNNNVGVQGFASMNVVTQTNVSSGVCLDNAQSFQADNSSRPYPNNPPVYYPLAAPALFNMQSYEQPQGPSPIYGYNQPMNNNAVVLSMPPSAFHNFIPPEIQSIPVNMIYNSTTTQVQNFMGINTPHGMYIITPRVPYPTINIIPGGMYNTVNVGNYMMPVYSPNSWHNSLPFYARDNRGYLPPGNYAYGVQGNIPQLTDPSQELDQEESTQPTTSEDIDDRGSARTRGFIKAMPQTNDPQSDNPNDNTGQACSPEGESGQTSVSKGGKTKKSTHKRTHERSPLRESSTNESSPEKGKVTGVMKFPECSSGEQFPEIITSAEGSQSSIHESGNWQKNVSRSSGGMAPAVATSEGGSLRNSDVNTSLISAHVRKKSRENYSVDPHIGIQTRSKTRELLSRKESEKSKLSERTMDVDGAAASPSASPSASATDVEGGNFTSRTRHRSSRTRHRKRKQSALGENRDMPEGNLPEELTETPTEHNNAVAASEAGISGAELEAPSSGPLGAGASRASPVDTRISEAVVEGDVSGTTLSVSLSSRNRRKTIGAIKNRPTKPQSVNQDSKVASQCSSCGLSNRSEIVQSEISELAAGISLGASTDSDIKEESTEEPGMRSKEGTRSTKRKVWEKSCHSISRSSKRADFSEAIAESVDLQSADEIKEETDDSSGEPDMSVQMLEVMPSTSSGQTATGAIPKTGSNAKVKPTPLIIITDTDTTSTIFKTLPTENIIESEPSSTSINRNRLSIPLVDIHRPGTSESQPGTSDSQPGTSDQRQRSSREITLDRIQEVESILTRQRNNYNSILNMLRVIDDDIIEACLVEEDQEDP